MSFDFVPRRVKGQARARPSASSAKASSSRILAAVSASPSISTLPSQSKVEDEEGTSRIEAIAEALMEVLSPMYLDRSGNEVLSNKLKTLPPNECEQSPHRVLGCVSALTLFFCGTFDRPARCAPS